MYHFSRSLYRDLAPRVTPGRGEDVDAMRRELLRACERSMERLALDRHCFARPVKTLFTDIRHLFPIGEQLTIYRACEHTMTFATDYVDTMLREGVTYDGRRVCCEASTRRGTACRRLPLPGNRFCPSHKHLEEDREVHAA